MKVFYFTFLLFLIHFASEGNDPNAYLLKLEVSCEEDTVQGYMSLVSSEKVDSLFIQQLKSSDSLFTSFLLGNNPDTLFLYKDIFRIDSLDVSVFLKDQLVAIDEAAVEKIHLDWIKENKVKASVYRYSTEDLTWLKQPYMNKEIYYYGNCTYTIFHFQVMEKHDFHTEGSKYLNNVDLTYDETFEWEKLMMDYLEWLKGKRVIVTSSCLS